MQRRMHLYLYNLKKRGVTLYFAETATELSRERMPVADIIRTMRNRGFPAAFKLNWNQVYRIIQMHEFYLVWLKKKQE